MAEKESITTTIRIDKEKHKKLRLLSLKKELSMNDIMEKLITMVIQNPQII